MAKEAAEAVAVVEEAAVACIQCEMETCRTWAEGMVKVAAAMVVAACTQLETTLAESKTFRKVVEGTARVAAVRVAMAVRVVVAVRTLLSPLSTGHR